jgi:hypothetical protein
MELGKYKLAMRPKKYLTREFVVYKAAPEAMDDVIEENPPYEAVMPSGTPPMDNYMPEIPGMEDPSLQQIELADGGVVQREGFKFGNTKELTEKMLELGFPENSAYIKEPNKLARQYGLERKPDPNNLQRYLYNYTDKQLSDILNTIESNPSKPGSGKFKKAASIFNDEKLKKEFIKYGSKSGITTEDIRKKYNLSKEEFFESGLRDLFTKDFQTDYRPGIKPKTIENMNLLLNDKTIANQLNNGSLPDLDVLKKKFKLTPHQAANTVYRIAQAMKGIGFENISDLGIKKNNKAGKQLLQRISSSAFNNPYSDAARKDAMALVDKQMGNRTGTFRNFRTGVLNSLKDAGINPKLLNLNEIVGINPAVKNTMGPYSQFVNLLEADINQKQMASFQSMYTRKTGDLIKAVKTGDKTKIQEVLNSFEQSKNNFLEKLPEKTKIKIEKAGLPGLSIKAPEIEYGKKRISELGKLGIDLPSTFEKTGVTMTVPKGSLTVQEFTKEKIDEIISQLKPAEKKIFSDFGNKLSSFGGGVDPTDILKTLPEKDYQIMKGAMSKVGNLAKMGARGAQELLVGTGPVGLGITAALTVPFMVADLAEGKRFSEALQNQASALTFGLVPEADKRIIEEIGGPEAGVGFEIQQNIDKLKSLQNDLREAESKQQEDMMDPEASFAQSSYLDNTRKELQRTFEFLLPYLNEQGQIIAPEYNAYLKASNKAQQERTLRKGIGELEAYNTGFDDTSIPEEGPFQQEIDKYSKAEEQLKKSYFKKQEQPLGFLGGVNTYKALPADDLINQYAYGGRVNFEKGSDPKDKPILPINPMIGGEDPRGSLQDPGRRDVLKGMGLLGAGIAAGKLGLLKLGKAIKKAPLTNIVKPMGATITKFPSWFPGLINRFRKEGKKIPIYKEVEVPLTKAEYDKLYEEGVTVYDRHLGRTDWYIEDLIKKGEPRYYTEKKTDEIIGYKYEVKDLPNILVKEMNGEEIRIYFPNAYGRNVEMTYTAPKVTIDTKGKKVKYDAEFEVNDAVPETAGPEDVPDFMPRTVDSLDDVYGGASKLEQYATKAKQPRTTLGDEVVNRWDAGQPSMTVQELKETRKQKLKETRKQRRRGQAEAKAVELGKPSAFDDTEFLEDFYKLGDEIE